MQSIHLNKQANVYSHGSERGLYVHCSDETDSCLNTEIYVTNTSDLILSCPYNCTSVSTQFWIPPTPYPTQHPSLASSTLPSHTPTIIPSQSPTNRPSYSPTFSPSVSPTSSPTICADTFMIMNIEGMNYNYSKSEIFGMNETNTINCAYNGHCSDYTLNISHHNKKISQTLILSIYIA